jgi:RNA polymerase sigma-70 factor, ECF subfamily
MGGPEPSRRDEEIALRTDELGARARGGSEGAFQALFERVNPALQAWIRLRMRGRETDAQDVLQEVWIRAVRGFASYDEGRSFRGWLLGIAKNVVLQARDRKLREGTLARFGSTETHGGLAIPDSATSVSLRAEENETLQRFLAYLDDLEEEERKLVLYCGLEELSLPEAAARLGIGTEAATKRWQVLRARMRENGMLRALALDGS